MAEEVSIECFEKLLEKEKIKMVSVCQVSDCSFHAFPQTPINRIVPLKKTMLCRSGRPN